MNAITPTTAIPAFDLESPDDQILAAFERVRAARAYQYGFDGILDQLSKDQEAQLAELDLVMIEDEGQVRDNVANTLPGVVAQLLLLIPAIDQSRWIDRGLMEKGFLALYHEIESLNSDAQQIAYAVHELIEIEWQQNLAAYDKSTADFATALRLNGLVDAERFRRRDAGEASCSFLDQAEALAEALDERFSNDREVQRLVRTLTPDHDAYLRKVEIVRFEGIHDDALLWLARDTNYLVGRIEPADLPDTESR